MMAAINTPSTRISTGSTSVSRRLMPVSTSRFKMAASSSIMGPTRPVSSPTRTRLMARGSKMPVDWMACTTLPPSLTIGATRTSDCCSTTLPTVSVAMCKAVSMGTPLPSRVPSEREKSVSWYFSAMLPTSGSRSRRACHQLRPEGERNQRATSQPSPTTAIPITRPYCVKALPRPITMRVGAGRASPISAKSFSNCGTTKPSMTTSEMMATVTRMAG